MIPNGSRWRRNQDRAPTPRGLFGGLRACPCELRNSVPYDKSPHLPKQPQGGLFASARRRLNTNGIQTSGADDVAGHLLMSRGDPNAAIRGGRVGRRDDPSRCRMTKASRHVRQTGHTREQCFGRAGQQRSSSWCTPRRRPAASWYVSVRPSAASRQRGCAKWCGIGSGGAGR